MKAIRYIIFIPIIYLIIFLVYSLIPISLFGLMSLSKFWIIILLIFFGGLVVGLFQLLPGGITWLSAKISPSKNFAFYSILTISVLLGISKIIYYWTMTDAYEDNFGVFFAILLTCLTIGFAVSLSVGAGIEMLKLAAQNKDAARIMRQMIKYPEKLQKVELDEITLLMRDFLFVEFARMNIEIPDFVFELVPDFGEEEDS